MANSYFDLFENITLDEVQIINLFQQFSFKDYLTDSEELFNFINVIDQDSPESLAERFYGSRSHYWIILLSNKTKDYFYDWPLKDNEIKEYSAKRTQALRDELSSDAEFISKYISYGQTGDDFQTIFGNVISSMYNDLVTENDSKRKLKYLKPRFLGQFLSAVTEKKT